MSEISTKIFEKVKIWRSIAWVWNFSMIYIKSSGLLSIIKVKISRYSASFKGVGVNSKTLTFRKNSKIGYKSRDTGLTIFWYRYSESASKTTPPHKFWAISNELHIFQFFHLKFRRKFWSKINFLLEGSKFAGRGSFWCWFRILTPKNRQTNITWVMALFSKIYKNGHFLPLSPELGLRGFPKLRSVLIQVEPREFKYVIQIAKIDAELAQNLEKPKIFHENFEVFFRKIIAKIEISFFREFIAK